MERRGIRLSDVPLMLGRTLLLLARAFGLMVAESELERGRFPATVTALGANTAIDALT